MGFTCSRFQIYAFISKLSSLFLTPFSRSRVGTRKARSPHLAQFRDEGSEDVEEGFLDVGRFASDEAEDLGGEEFGSGGGFFQHYLL